jgi:hypothetical protein
MAAMLICTILLYVWVLDIIYGLVTKKIAVGNLRKIIVTPKEDNLFLYIIIYKRAAMVLSNLKINWMKKTYFYLRHVVIVVTADATISITPVLIT